MITGPLLAVLAIAMSGNKTLIAAGRPVIKEIPAQPEPSPNGLASE
jgi:hypothetical protein